MNTEEATKIVLIAGPDSHGPGAHEHRAGCLLLADLLNEHVAGVRVVVNAGGWPEDPGVLDGAAAVIVYSDGGVGHPVLPHLEQAEEIAAQGVGIAMLHYAVEVPKGEAGDSLLDWIGGYFETDWSVNPHWTAEFASYPNHPATRGLTPFSMEDEWYFHMRFPEEMRGVAPLLSAVAPESTMERPDGLHSGNPQVRKSVAAGDPQHLAWCVERADGGRGLGFTGGHYHSNWANDNLRRFVLNSIVWTAGLEIPHGGVATPTPTEAQLDGYLKTKDNE